ncbi:MAG TPA: ATP-binding protein, partial [Acetobacteraceae bacterium]|nr:ATP-binding protein [Acetobacteraceae bacterium]
MRFGMRRLWSGGISRQLQLVAVILLLGMLGLASQQLLRTRAALLAQTEQQMARLDMVFAEQTGRALETIDLILQSVAEDFRRGPPTATGAADAISASLARRIAMVRQSTGIAIADRHGRLVYASDPVLLDEQIPPGVKATIDSAIDHPQSSLQITEPFRRRDGLWTALIVRPVPEADGSDRFAAIAFLNLLYFEDFYKAVELTEDGAILLHRRDGTVLARFPHDDRVIGRSYAELPPFKDVLAHAMAGTLVMDSPMSGKSRVLAIRALKAFPVAVNVSVGETQVLRLWRRQAWVFVVTSVVIAAVTIGLLLLLATRSSENERLVQRLRAAKETAEAANRRMVDEMAERERVEGALRQAQRLEAIGRLTGGVAHDFNNLLAIVMGNIDLLERTLPPDQKTLGRLATMRAATERGATLTNQLLAFSRRQPLMPRAADLNGLVTGLRDLVQSAVGSRVRLQLRLEATLTPALIDPAQIELVILNLAINARDAMPQGGTLTIETAPAVVASAGARGDLSPGPYVLLIVRDDGVGMSPEVAAKAFEPFFTTKEVGRGSGLGLSQVYGVARQLGGGARIESAPGEGTAVLVYLPRAGSDASGTVERPRRQRSLPVSPATVLVVDDDHAVR